MRLGTVRRVVASVGMGMLLVGPATPATADVVPKVVPGLATVAERDSGVRVVEIPVTLSEPSSEWVTADWTTIVGPQVRPPSAAEPGTDFQSASGTVAFEPGSTETTVAITVFGDDLPESDDWIVMMVHNPQHAVMGGYWGLGFGIIDDDDTPFIGIPPAGFPATEIEGDAGPQTLRVWVLLSFPSAHPVTVDWRTVPRNEVAFATEGLDYLAGSGTITVPPGAIRGDGLLTVLGDTAVEGDELIVVEFSNPRNGVLVARPEGPIGYARIMDDD
jgi:Calx-beta domain